MSDPRPEFAEFSARKGAAAPIAAPVRRIVVADAHAVAELNAARNHTVAAEIEPQVRRDFEEIVTGGARRYCSVAEVDTRVVGYARTQWMDLDERPGVRNAPSGWYLTGVVVAPAHRRRGIGRALTRDRLEFLERAGAREVWYFANSENRVTIALHARLGFEEVTRDFAIPGLTFADGQGVLHRRRATAAH